MKNIHLIPTDKPSRLFYSDSSKTLMLSSTAVSFRTFERSTQHIYITTNEEIKEGEWFYDNDGEICKYTSDYNVNPNKWDDNEKVILTTDQDLISDGIQPIDDDFLEWFVKNPSCEYVEVVKGFADGSSYGYNFIDYKIIIPQEEPKEETLEEVADKKYPTFHEHPQYRAFIAGAKWQQETTERLVKLSRQDAFYEGAKWQQERMYTEEDMRKIFNYGKGIGGLGLKDDFNEYIQSLKQKQQDL